MTTRVTVAATSHDVEVRQHAPTEGSAVSLSLVTKGSEATFFAHQGNVVDVKEVPDV